MEIKGVLRVVRGVELKFSLPAPSITIKANGTIWYQGVPVLGAPEDKKAEMSKLVKAKKWDEIPAGYYVKLGDNDNGLWAGDDEAWDKHPVKLAEDAKRAKKEIEDKKIVKIYLSSRGWGDYSSLNWIGDITRSDSDIIKECRELLFAGHDVDKPNQSDDDILRLVQEAREDWATPSEEAEIDVGHGVGYCYSCEGYCYGDCGDYQPEMTRKIMSSHDIETHTEKERMCKMGKSYAAINFMVLDKTPVDVISASGIEDFNLCDLNGFANRRGTFSQDVQNSKHYIFNGIDGRFVEFNILD